MRPAVLVRDEAQLEFKDTQQTASGCNMMTNETGRLNSIVQHVSFYVLYVYFVCTALFLMS